MADAQSFDAFYTAAAPRLTQHLFLATTGEVHPLPPTPKTDPASDVTNTFNSGNYSGVVNYASSVTKAYARRVSTSSNSATCGTAAHHSDWVGIGGAGSSSLLQNGMAEDYSTGSYAWWEYVSNSLPSAAEVRIGLGVTYGDSVSISTQYIPNGSGGYVQFSWHNGTQGTSQVVNWSGASGYTAAQYWGSGQQTWVVDERPTVGSSFAPLRNFGTTYWDNAQYYVNGSGSSSWTRSGSADFINMVNGSGTHLSDAYAGSTTDSFHDTCKACS